MIPLIVQWFYNDKRYLIDIVKKDHINFPLINWYTVKPAVIPAKPFFSGSKNKE